MFGPLLCHLDQWLYFFTGPKIFFRASLHFRHWIWKLTMFELLTVEAKIKILFVSPLPTDPIKSARLETFNWLPRKKKKLFRKTFRFRSGKERKSFVQFQFGILLELRMTSSKVIEANPYRNAITTIDTTWCVSVPVLSKTGKVEKTLISNTLEKVGSFSECYSCALTSAKYECI